MPKYVECRTYVLKVGTTDQYLRLYESIGYEIQSKYLGEPLGFFRSEIGQLNKIVHMWGYDSLDDRAERRARLFADLDWIDFLIQAWPLLESQTSEIMLSHIFKKAGQLGGRSNNS